MFTALALMATNVLAQSDDTPGPMHYGTHAESAANTADTKPPVADPSFDVNKLFANTCGWCHSDAGRKAGKGPQLMGTARTDAEIIYRIKNGKTGQMPSFGSAFSDEQIQAIIAYIRTLKPDDK
jgi:mono/diheme cytochrome c family protein